MSKVFRMTSPTAAVTDFAIVRLMARTDAHKAQYPGGISRAMSDIVTSHARQKKNEWVVKKNQGHLRLDQSAVSWVQFPIRGLGQVR